MGISWDGMGQAWTAMEWDGMGQKNLSHEQTSFIAWYVDEKTFANEKSV